MTIQKIISCCRWKRPTNVAIVEVDMCFAGPLYIPKFNLQIQEIVKLFHNQSIFWTTGLHSRIKYQKKKNERKKKPQTPGALRACIGFAFLSTLFNMK